MYHFFVLLLIEQIRTKKHKKYVYCAPNRNEPNKKGS